MSRSMPYGGPDYSTRESISTAGGQPLEGVAGGGGGGGRPGHWGSGYARHLIPFGIHTLDIRHVIPGLRSRCGGATCPQAARTSQDETTSSSNSCPSRRVPSPSANEC